MTLSSLIRKRDTVGIATAIPAISATQPKGEAATVARIATVAVANPNEEKTAPPAKVAAGGGDVMILGELIRGRGIAPPTLATERVASLIRKRDTVGIATAIPAISATQPKGEAATVARIATVAVANPNEEKTAPPAKVGAGETATASRWWLIHYPDRDPLKVSFSPPMTFDEVMVTHPDAVAAEPFTPSVKRPEHPLTPEEEGLIRRWLAAIGETDAAAIAEVIRQCREDEGAADYFLGRASGELPKPDPLPDDRRLCTQCRNLNGRRCMAAARGEIVASRRYEPVLDLPRRCTGFMPLPDDPDQRSGRERWGAVL